MELMFDAISIGHTHGRELRMFEGLNVRQIRHPDVKTPAAEQAEATIRRSNADNVMWWGDGPTPDTGVIGHQRSFSAHGFDSNFRTFTGAMIFTGGRPLLPSGVQAIRSVSRDFWHGGAFVVMFPDISEAAITQGDTLEEARVMAADALLAAIEVYIEDTRNVPWRDDSKGARVAAGLCCVTPKALVL
jgi:predicted RNase H-like HicB family nuclease